MISVIITTYNRPDALELVLKALAEQDVAYDDFEVIIADDGSTSVTKKMLKAWQKKSPFSLKHVWQKHLGFRAGKARNNAVKKARGDYLIFLDGDSVPLTSFIRRHRKLASPGYFVVGNRILLNKSFTKKVLSNSWPIYRWTFWKWFNAYCHRFCNRFLPFLTLPLGVLRKLRPKTWQGAKTCNLGMWRKDFLKVHGFDESFFGWGYEDSDLVIRLIKRGIKRKDGHFAVPVLHLWHAGRKRSLKNYAKIKRFYA
jgi:glycosyltransferase involved in cell wall biosynthesis